MKNLIREHKALRESLRRAHFLKEDVEVGNRWRTEAMRRIRAAGPLKVKSDFWPGLEQLTWRLAPVTCGLMLVLSMLFIGSDSFHDYEILSVFTGGTEELSLTEILGFGA